VGSSGDRGGRMGSGLIGLGLVLVSVFVFVLFSQGLSDLFCSVLSTTHAIT
jgi:hypothetical protein